MSQVSTDSTWHYYRRTNNLNNSKKGSMKQFYILIFTLISSFVNAQQAYYSDVDLSLEQDALKSALAQKIIATHTNFLTYTPGIWEASKITDSDPDNASNVLLIYGYNDTDGNHVTDRSRSKDLNGGNEGTDWNREHTYPRSLGTPNLGSEGPGSDAHHLRPSDVIMNSDRGNRKFIDGSGNAGAISGGWYPGDEWKGDVARMMMYMYLHYGNRCLPTNVGIGTDVSSFDDMIDLFLKWNAEDEVSQIEIQRNAYHDSNDTYAQGNRNPFIDNPFLATRIWGGQVAEDIWGIYSTDDDEAPSAVTDLTTSNPMGTSIDLSWTAATDNISVVGYDIYVDNVNTFYSANTTFTATGLMGLTEYCFTVYAKDLNGNVSTVSNESCATTLEVIVTPSTELFFSEYVEGTGFNKALEIANITGEPINLAAYSIKRNGNGGAAWEDGLALSGILNSGDVFVVINSLATDTNLQAEFDVAIENSTPMTFNGNDALGLFKNDVLIDIIGEFGNADVFASDVTLRRKNSVTEPNLVFDLVGEWDSFERDNTINIGEFSGSLGVDESALEVIRMYPNPAQADFVTIKSNEDILAEVYDILGKKVTTQNISQNQNKLNISALSKGVYLVKLKSNKGSITKKLIKN